MPQQRDDASADRPVGRLERAARAVDDVRTRVDKARRALVSPAGMRGVAVETAWVATHVAMWPFGLLEEQSYEVLHGTQLAGLSPVQRGLLVSDVEAAGTPIILVHGIVDNRSVFALLRRGLRRRGFGRVVSVNYSSLTGDIRVLAAKLAEVVDEVCHDTGYERVHVVGHSMGGLIARYYVQRLAGDQRVHTLVTLGTPHAGTQMAYALPHPLVRQLRPGSDVVTELTEAAPGCRTRFVAVWSDLDQMIAPKQSAMIAHDDLVARNVFIRGVGHMSLPVDGGVVHEICTTLAHLDADGTTLAAGATSIASSPARRQGRSVHNSVDGVARGRTRP
jgi:pimeloyl-ACP methyl ester carboxylesterase